jgi:F plasmid transfer operon, TraF, protein
MALGTPAMASAHAGGHDSGIVSILPSRLDTERPSGGSVRAKPGSAVWPGLLTAVTLAQMPSARMFLASVLLACLGWPEAAWAQQTVESVGSRALGMGGAFVAVADDATAVYWNPAGLASGPPGGMTIGWVDFHSGNQHGPSVPGPGARQSKFVSLGTWPIGLSYGSFQEGRLLPASNGATTVEVLRVSQFGATVLQSLMPGLVVGSTLKYVRGSLISGPATGDSAHQAFANAAHLEGSSSSHFDLDVGTMADFGRARLGLSLRNLHQPTFEADEETAIVLKRQARMGLAVLPTAGLTLAMDLDLNTVDLRDGPRRNIAFGGENRFGRRWAFRGGVRWSLEGPRHMVGALGASVRVRPNVWLDTHYTRGRIDADRGFGAALRAGF